MSAQVRDHEHVLTTAPTSASKSSPAADFTLYILVSIAVPGPEQKDFPDTARICMGNPHTNSVWQIHILICMGNPHTNFVWQIHILILYVKTTYKKVHRLTTILPNRCLPRTFLGFVLWPEYRWRFSCGFPSDPRERSAMST